MKTINDGDVRWFAFYKGTDITPVNQGYGGKGALVKELMISLYPTNSKYMLNDLYGGSWEKLEETWRYLLMAEPIGPHEYRRDLLDENEFKYYVTFKEKEKLFLKDVQEPVKSRMIEEINEIQSQVTPSTKYIDYPIEINRKISKFVEKYGWYPAYYSDTSDAVSDFIKKHVEFRKYTIKISKDKLVK